MLVGDRIDVNLITEQAGVASSNHLYFEVSDATLNDTLEAVLLEIATAFNAALGVWRSSSAVLTCATWRNVNNNDPFTQTFFNIPGLGGANALPTQAAARVRRYATNANDIIVGAINIVGLVETQVERGRLVGAGELGTIESFMANALILVAGPTLLQGFWYDTNTPGPASWVLTSKAQTVSRIRTLEKRKSVLCGQ